MPPRGRMLMLGWLFLLRSSQLLFCSITHIHARRHTRVRKLEHLRARKRCLFCKCEAPRGWISASYPVCDLSLNTAVSPGSKTTSRQPTPEPHTHTRTHMHARTHAAHTTQIVNGWIFQKRDYPAAGPVLRSPLFPATDAPLRVYQEQGKAVFVL